jgi:hypothetical protein
MVKSTVEKAADAGLAVPDYEKFIGYITEQAHNAPDGSEINEKIFAATSVEDVLGGVTGEAIHAENIVDVPLLVRSVRFNPSDVTNPNALPAYAVMDCIDTQGEVKVVTCGATTVMAQLYKLIVLGAFDNGASVAVVIRRSKKPTRNGFYPMNLENAQKAFEAGF